TLGFAPPLSGKSPSNPTDEFLMSDYKDRRQDDDDARRFRGAGLAEWDRFVEMKIEPALGREGLNYFLEDGNFYPKITGFVDHQVAELLLDTAMVIDEGPPPPGTPLPQGADVTIITSTPIKLAAPKSLEEASFRRDYSARWSEHKRHLADAAKAMTCFSGFVARPMLSKIKGVKGVYEANTILREYYAGRNPAASSTVHAFDVLATIREPDVTKRSSLEAFANSFRRLAADYDTYLRPLSHDEMLLKMMSNMAMRSTPEKGHFTAIRHRLVRSPDDGGYADWKDLLSDVENAVQLTSEYGAHATKPHKAHEREPRQELAKSAANKRPPKGKGAKGTKSSPEKKPWDGVTRAAREILGLPKDFDRSKAKPGDYGTCTSHGRWEPHTPAACRSKPASAPARAKVSRPAPDDAASPKPAAKAARTTKLLKAGSSAVADFLAGGAPTGFQRGHEDFALRVQSGACGAGEGDDEALSFFPDQSVVPKGPNAACMGRAVAVRGDRDTRRIGGKLEDFVLPPPALAASSLEQRAGMTPAEILGFSPTVAPRDFARKTPAKRITLKEYINRSAYVSVAVKPEV
ncbi:hypothetical protein HK405_000744, partial [Cladochytrium tenue]